MEASFFKKMKKIRKIPLTFPVAFGILIKLLRRTSLEIANELKILKKEKKVVDKSKIAQYNNNVPLVKACTL